MKSRLIRLMTHLDTDVKHCAADLIFVLCKENGTSQRVTLCMLGKDGARFYLFIYFMSCTLLNVQSVTCQRDPFERNEMKYGPLNLFPRNIQISEIS